MYFHVKTLTMHSVRTDQHPTAVEMGDVLRAVLPIYSLAM